MKTNPRTPKRKRPRQSGASSTPDPRPEHSSIEVTFRQGPPLEGKRLVAALKRLVEIGRRVEREERLQEPKNEQDR
jgi:hypothetical protein